MRRVLKLSVLPALLALGAGCSSHPGPAAQSSALTGRIDSASFGNKSLLVVAIDRRGTVHTAAVNTSGAFRLTLPAHATYRLAIRDTTTGIRTPLVFPRQGSQQRLLRVRAGGAVGDLGTVRALLSTASVAATQDNSGDQCMDGLDPAGKACVDDKAESETQSCGETAEDTSKDNDNVDNQSGDTSAQTDTAEGPESTTEIAVPSANPPTELGGWYPFTGRGLDTWREKIPIRRSKRQIPEMLASRS